MNELLDKTVEYLGALKRLGQKEIALSGETLRALRQSKAVSSSLQSQPKSAPVKQEKPMKPREMQPMPALDESTVAFTPTGNKEADLEALRNLTCVKCSHLAKTRKNVVFGVGNPNAEIMFVGEAPGADEDAAGEPFVGKAGQLLTKMIQAMGLTREQVYIANVLKCRPDMPPGSSGNRKPTSQEMATCLPYLRAQIRIIQPRALVALGATALEGLLGQTKIPMSKLRGTWQEFDGIPFMPTYHPAYLLRDQSIEKKRIVWEDLLAVMEKVGLPISDKQRRYFLKAV
ncbi:MAG: uracil-DNA glycosylase [bacterium]